MVERDYHNVISVATCAHPAALVMTLVFPSEHLALHTNCASDHVIKENVSDRIPYLEEK